MIFCLQFDFIFGLLDGIFIDMVLHLTLWELRIQSCLFAVKLSQVNSYKKQQSTMF